MAAEFESAASKRADSVRSGRPTLEREHQPAGVRWAVTHRGCHSQGRGLSLTGERAVTHRGRAVTHRGELSLTGGGLPLTGRGVMSLTGERAVTQRGEGCQSQGRRLSLTGGGEVSLTGAVIHEVGSVELLVTTH